MFLNVHDYAFASTFERRWTTILAEYESIPADRLVHWPERELYDFGWRAFPLIALGQTISTHAALCPETMRFRNALLSFPLLELVQHLHDFSALVFVVAAHV